MISKVTSFDFYLGMFMIFFAYVTWTLCQKVIQTNTQLQEAKEKKK